MTRKGMAPKRRGFGLEVKTFRSKSGREYLVFKTLHGAFHVFVETQAKDAAQDCGAERKGTTVQMWGSLWQSSN
jgi:hypothetical protein